MSKYPQHDKLEEVADKSQAIGEFLEWAEMSGMFLAEMPDKDASYPMFPVRVRQSREVMLARHFGINLLELEREKREMLEQLRRKS